MQFITCLNSNICLHIIKNLDSCHESLSRQITVFQQLIKMNDFSRGGLPDYDFGKARDVGIDNESDDIDTSELQEENF